MSAMRNSTKMTEMTADTTDEGDEVEVVEVTTSLSPRLQSGTYTITVKHHSLSVKGSDSGKPRWSIQFLKRQKQLHKNLHCIPGRREQYYWVRYWFWVILGYFRTIAIDIGIVKGFSKYWYWYWVLLRAFQSIGIGIGYC